MGFWKKLWVVVMYSVRVLTAVAVSKLSPYLRQRAQFYMKFIDERMTSRSWLGLTELECNEHTHDIRAGNHARLLILQSANLLTCYPICGRGG
jgi:hypothetical protein